MENLKYMLNILKFNNLVIKKNDNSDIYYVIYILI